MDYEFKKVDGIDYHVLGMAQARQDFDNVGTDFAYGILQETYGPGSRRKVAASAKRFAAENGPEWYSDALSTFGDDDPDASPEDARTFAHSYVSHYMELISNLSAREASDCIRQNWRERQDAARRTCRDCGDSTRAAYLVADRCTRCHRAFLRVQP